MLALQKVKEKGQGLHNNLFLHTKTGLVQKFFLLGIPQLIQVACDLICFENLFACF